MESSLAILIPSYGRPDRFASIVANIEKTTKTPHTIYFVIEQTDTASINIRKTVESENVKSIIVDGGTYVSAINAGYKHTSEPFVFCGSDDIEFTPGWDIGVMKEFEKPSIGFVGVVDDWTITKTGHHASHFAVRREYIKTQSGVEDETDVIYSSKYHHIMCDIETEQTAMKRGAFAIAAKSVIPHHHWFTEKVPKDATYLKAIRDTDHDGEVFGQRRKRFERWYFDSLFWGKSIPVNQGKLSIVLPSYNIPEFLKGTLESIRKNTYHDYELIIVDDMSDAQTVRMIEQYPEKCKKFISKEKLYTTKAWNTGVALATGDFVAILNNDITLSRHWDVHMMNALRDPDTWIASAYQTDPGVMEPYGKHERAGNIDLRGTCYMLKRESIKKLFPLPENLVMWFSDWWLAWSTTEKNKKKSVFVPESIVHHFGSKSSQALDERTGAFYWILRGDAYAFEKMTGINVSHWHELIAGKLRIPFSKN